MKSNDPSVVYLKVLGNCTTSLVVLHFYSIAKYNFGPKPLHINLLFSSERGGVKISVWLLDLSVSLN